MLKKMVSLLVAVSMFLMVPMEAFALKDSDFKPIPIEPSMVTTSDIEIPFLGDPGIEIRMSNDNPKGQKRVPVIDEAMDMGLSYRVPTSAKISRKHAVTKDEYGIYSSYEDRIDTKNYTITARFYPVNEMNFYMLEEETKTKYGKSGWKDYFIKNTAMYSEKINKTNAIIYGVTGSGHTTFQFVFQWKKGKKLDELVIHNLICGLEVFRMKQQIKYIGNKNAAKYIVELSPRYVAADILYPMEGEFGPNEYNPSSELEPALPAEHYNGDSIWPANPYYQQEGLLDPSSIDFVGKDQPHYQNADPYTKWVLDNYNQSLQNIYDYGTMPYRYETLDPSLYYQYWGN